MQTADTISVSTALGLDTFSELASMPENFSPFLVAIRRHLHQYPELGLQEYETSRFVRQILSEYGLSVSTPFAGTGLAVDIKGDFPGPKIAYRADLDALPIQDTKEVSYASSVSNVAHLCGHDAHTTIAIGVALLLSRLRHLIHGSVRVFFQPNEEGIPSGAPLMIEDGILDRVEAAFCIHVDPTLHVGTYGLKAGAITASADRFRIRVHGPTTGHSARPHQSTDTVWIANQIMNSLYQLVGRVTDSRNSAIITITRLRGGEAYNVIPAEVEFGGTFRCIEHGTRKTLGRQITATSNHIAEMYGARVDVQVGDGAPPVRNDENLVQIARTVLEARLGSHAIYEVPVPSMGAEDFAHYLKEIPGMLLRVGTSSGTSTSFPLHDSCFDIDEIALEQTSGLMAAILISALHAENPAVTQGPMLEV